MKVFVFGSNRQGRHGKGAALHALRSHGAVYGRPEGLQGRSYAIVTKELRAGFPPVTLDEVARGVAKFIDFARGHQDMEFVVSPIGCGLAGFRADQIAPLFVGHGENVILPEVFKNASPTSQTRG